MTAAGAPPRDGTRLSFLEAQRVLEDFPGGEPLSFLLAMSGTSEPLRVFVDAACALHERRAAVRLLPFGTLGQHLTATGDGEAEVVILYPWDFVPELDWRSGIPSERIDVAEASARAHAAARLIARRAHTRALYIDAPTPPVAGSECDDEVLRLHIRAAAAAAGARPFTPESFSLANYLASGCPASGSWLGRLAVAVVDLLMEPTRDAAKVIVTDLDNTLWAGVLADAGIEGVACGPDAAGYSHYIYQTVLKRLHSEGALLAVVSRNDPGLVNAALASNGFLLGANDFVAVYAGYQAKSSQVRDLAQRLNIGLDAFIVVDDSDIERHEIASAIPEARVLAFPDRADALPAFLHTLSAACSRRLVTEEDRSRTALYRRRLDTAPPSHAAGADLTEYLASLRMRLAIHDRSRGDRVRAVQLINKTNQFNANGRRWTDDEVGEVLARGGRLITATLDDRAGSHGEIIACLLDADGVVDAMVMSCRVFQRRVEDAFLAGLADRSLTPAAFRFTATPRNEPFQSFIGDAAFAAGADGLVRFDAPAWLERHRNVLELVEVHWH